MAIADMVVGQTPIEELVDGIKSNAKKVIKDEFESCGVTYEHIMILVDINKEASVSYISTENEDGSITTVKEPLNKILDIELTILIDKDKSKEAEWPRGMLRGENIYSHLGWYIGHEAWLPYIESYDIHIIDFPNSGTDIIRYLDNQLVVRYNFIVHLNHYV